MSIFHGFYDTAGTERDDEVLVTVGVIATEEKWAKHERRWRNVLERFGVSSLHMKKFAHFKGEFAAPEWRVHARRDEFLAALCSAVKLGINKAFISSVLLPDYRKQDLTHEVTETIGGPYSLAQAGCIVQTVEWLARQKRPTDKVALFVEEGDVGQAAFKKFLQRELGKDFTIHFRPKADETGAPLYQFQAADLIAYEHRRMYARIVATGTRQPREAWRRSLEAVRRLVPFESSIYTAKSLESMCQRGIIPPRGEGVEHAG